MRKKTQVFGRLRVQPLRLLAADVSETAQVYLLKTIWAIPAET